MIYLYLPGFKALGYFQKNMKFLQLLSNTLSTNIKKPDQIESTAVGAFKIALLGSGIKNIDEIKNFNLGGYVFSESLTSSKDWVFTR